MIRLYDRQVDEIIECETRRDALAYVNKYDLCVWDKNGNMWEIRPRKAMFKDMQLIQGGY